MYQDDDVLRLIIAVCPASPGLMDPCLLLSKLVTGCCWMNSTWLVSLSWRASMACWTTDRPSLFQSSARASRPIRPSGCLPLRTRCRRAAAGRACRRAS